MGSEPEYLLHRKQSRVSEICTDENPVRKQNPEIVSLYSRDK
jgi:hypothetical protein